MSLKESMQTVWVDWDKTPFSSPIDKITYRKITLKVPSNAKKGTYIFNIVACTEPIATSSATSYQNCKPTNFNWGTVQQLSITVD